MTVEKFQEQAVSIWRDQLVDIIRELTIVRKVFPVKQALAPSDNNYIYYKMIEDSAVQYGFELQQSIHNRYASQKVSTAVPILQGDMEIQRHELGRMSKDVFPLDVRTFAMIEDLNELEESKTIYGDANAGTTLSDTTNYSTAAGDELDLGTFKEGVEHWHASISQGRNLLKNKFQGCQIKIIWTSDVDDRARAIASTTSEEITFFDYIAQDLTKFNGGGGPQDHIFVSNYLGSATNAGTTNMAMIFSDPRNWELVVSDLEIIQEFDTKRNLEIQAAMRSKLIPLRGNDGAIYHGTVVLTA